MALQPGAVPCAPCGAPDPGRVYSGALRPEARSGAFAVLSVQLAESTEEKRPLRCCPMPCLATLRLVVDLQGIVVNERGS